jgi:hypothetical protein
MLPNEPKDSAQLRLAARPSPGMRSPSAQPPQTTLPDFRFVLIFMVFSPFFLLFCPSSVDTLGLSNCSTKLERARVSFEKP